LTSGVENSQSWEDNFYLKLYQSTNQETRGKGNQPISLQNSRKFMSKLIALVMEAARTSETLVNFYQTTRRYNPEDSHLRTHRRENLKSYLQNSRFGREGEIVTFLEIVT
jgi:hypothetical protein